MSTIDITLVVAFVLLGAAGLWLMRPPTGRV